MFQLQHLIKMISLILIFVLFCFLVQFSVLNIGADALGMASFPAFRVLRTLRGLRPLRAMSRLQGMKVSWGPIKGLPDVLLFNPFIKMYFVS